VCCGETAPGLALAALAPVVALRAKPVLCGVSIESLAAPHADRAMPNGSGLCGVVALPPLGPGLALCKNNGHIGTAGEPRLGTSTMDEELVPAIAAIQCSGTDSDVELRRGLQSTSLDLEDFGESGTGLAGLDLFPSVTCAGSAKRGFGEQFNANADEIDGESDLTRETLAVLTLEALAVCAVAPGTIFVASQAKLASEDKARQEDGHLLGEARVPTRDVDASCAGSDSDTPSESAAMSKRSRMRSTNLLGRSNGTLADAPPRHCSTDCAAGRGCTASTCCNNSAIAALRWSAS